MSTEQAATDGLVSERLARFIAASRWEDLPEKVRHEARRSLLNFFGAAIAGCHDSAVELAFGLLSTFAGPPVATVIGRPERTDMPTAAFLNAASTNVFDFDDTHIPTVIHPTAPVAPALLALAESRPVSGRDLLHAFVLGVEAECRIGNAVSPAHYRRGWHITATCGVFGAAAAVGRLQRLDARRLVWALGNASAQSSGLVETLGSMAKSLGVGNAARNGLLSGLLAERGFAGPDLPIEGPRGFAAVMGDGADLSAISADLGDRWEMLANTYKPYPCGVVLNPLIDACLELRERHEIAADRIRQVTVVAHPLLRERTDRPAVATGREAQVSAQHSAAVALLYGAAGLAQYTDAAVRDPAVLQLRARVRVEEDPAVPVGAVRVVLAMADGPELAMSVDHARGSLDRPMTDAELEAKFTSLAAAGRPGLQADRLLDAIWSIDKLDNVKYVLDLARPDS